MEQIGNMKLYSFEEVKDELIGKVGTPERDEHERKVAEAVHAYHIGEAIKKARLLQNLTQEQLGERVGVKKAQISRLERGYSITIPTMSRVFKALGISTATLDLGIGGKVALW
ncbi:MAG: helix-turn-helix domain-containing protein [Alloprevotella sp.]|jgi:toxin-antitoxin system, antitoxin component, xre family|uniref:helix-turn-helix domain-containing protein n=1 Tax=Alloprevotella sp. Lung230 TaxID=2766595 RepID=UPI000F2C17D6|nr:helix-turn-helix transcriptional regulator [Alloprevotella sp. Lung230]MBC8625774.1 helix-turn-helix transcriptional regulator [Alloprevotella sp. Lung230]RKV73764.1 MAG: XRE family transcriptional regulator [Alloprevotella sp.]